MRVGGRTGKTSFLAVLESSSGCVDNVGSQCHWHIPPGRVGELIWHHIPESCRYNPAPGSTAAWRYGCSVGFTPADLIDNRAGWNFATKYCDARYLGACHGHRP